MSVENTRILEEKLEPHTAGFARAFEASRAVSLVRIANAFERIATALEKNNERQKSKSE